MSTFDDRLEEYLSDQDDPTDIRAIVRRCYHYDLADVVDEFGGTGIRIWQGQGRLKTSDGNTWLGTQTKKGDYHVVPRLADGRDGSAPEYKFGFGYVDRDTYQALKTDRTKVFGRPLTIYLALFREGDGLRPDTPIEFFKELTMQSTFFEESVNREGTSLVKKYKLTIVTKDGNAGRSNVPGRSMADTMQKEYARQLGVPLDRGCEFLAGLANRTYKAPD